MPTAQPAPRRRIGARAALKPWRQGHFDGLCGLYAIVNAVRAVCPDLNATRCEALFKHLSRALHHDAKRPRNLITGGIHTALLWRLVAEARHFLAATYGVVVRAHRLPRPVRTTRHLQTIWRALAAELSGDAVAIISIVGTMDHWTVVTRVQNRQLHLLDSNDMRVLRRSTCDNRPWTGRHTILAQDVIVVSRAF
jgi:hypothetical protein